MTEHQNKLPRVGDKGDVELDWDQSLRIPKRGPMYRLPLRNINAIANEQWVLSADPAALRLLPGGEIASWTKGGFLFLAAMIFCAALSFLAALLPLKAEEKTDLLLLSVVGFPTSILFIISIIIIIHIKNIIFPWPLVINRRFRTLTQLQDKKQILRKDRQQAIWNELTPYVEVVRVANYGGVLQYYNLHLLAFEADAKTVRCHIAAYLRSGSIAEAHQHYEYLRRYMQGEWDRLPPVTVAPSVRKPLLEEYRSNFWNNHFNVPWHERSALRMSLGNVIFVMWNIFFWPLIMLTLLGSRMGVVPKWTKEDEAQAAYDPARDGPMPQALQDSLKQPPAMVPAERRWYFIVIAISTALWCLPPFGVIPNLLGLFVQALGTP